MEVGAAPMMLGLEFITEYPVMDVVWHPFVVYGSSVGVAVTTIFVARAIVIALTFTTLNTLFDGCRTSSKAAATAATAATAARQRKWVSMLCSAPVDWGVVFSVAQHLLR